jgi:membrane-bound lytic murein transglycosylase B
LGGVRNRSGGFLCRVTCSAALACWLGIALAPASAATSKKAHRPPAHGKGAPAAVNYGQREDVQRFGAELAERRGLDATWVQAALSAARFQPGVVKLIMPPPAGTAKNWAAYRTRFVEPRRVSAGLEFWRANERWLEQAEADYGVPPEIVVGIVGVETMYGQQMGNFRAIDALATLAFDFPAGRKDRSAFFRDELEQLFLLCGGAAERCDLSALRSSYAGAIGMPQFMPGSVNRYAVDFDGDGRIDLRGSAADAIGSVAHYLAEFGWQRGLTTRFEVAAPVDTGDRAMLLVPDIVPTFSAAQFAERGAQLGDPAQEYAGLLALVELQNGGAAPSYVAGTVNFYAITRYNWSSYYAMAVIELGAAVKQRLAATH